MDIKTARFLSSETEVKKFPTPNLPEFAFIGRSNVGKSSLINMLSNQKKLAKISARPGKTQTINHFLMNENWYLADMPGYGWAKVGKTKKAGFLEMNRKYFINRTNLVCTMVLIDSRLEPQAIDMEFIDWMGTLQIPFVLVFTKVDKHSVNKAQTNISLFKKKMLEKWEEVPEIFVTSAITGYGKDKILDFIFNVNQNFETQANNISQV
ncbi:MAG: ribosome biogenesis GTP-binding protein YihA/YsxC [Bacteroidota bacterium]|nr:ribosome biogenesis GTP-binding protein YihA/YsxC [Bacteroidota bacterium]